MIRSMSTTYENYEYFCLDTPYDCFFVTLLKRCVVFFYSFSWPLGILPHENACQMPG